MSNDTKKNGLGRREFLGKAFGATLSLAVVPSVLACACDAFAKQEPLAFSAFTIDLSLTANKALLNVNGSVKIASPAKFVATRISATEFSVVSGTCTHQGTTLNAYNSTTQNIYCPNHGSTFTAVGANINKASSSMGPLTRYKATFDSAANTVFVENQIFSGVEGTAASILTLEQNYPNPFSASTTIKFTLSEPSSISIHVHSVSGSEVMSESLGKLGIGDHSFTLGAQSLVTGTYFYELRTERGSIFKQMEIVR